MSDRGGPVSIYAGGTESSSAVAFGLAVLRRGDGGRVALIRFIEPATPAEVEAAQRLGIDHFGTVAPGSRGGRGESAGDDWRSALELVSSEKYDLVVLDGILDAVETGLVLLAEVEDLLQKTPPLELILTGRSSPVELVKRADTAVEMLDIKR